MSESLTSPSPEVSSLPLKLTDKNIGGSSSKRSNGMNKSKLKRRKNEDISAIMYMLIEENRKFRDVLTRANRMRTELRDVLTHANQIRTRKLELTVIREHNKILLLNLDSIPDPSIREYFRNEQQRILQKRIQQQQQRG